MAKAAAKSAKTDPLDKARAAVLDEMLPHVAFDGWSARAMREAAKRAGVDKGTLRLAFPGGIIDLITYFCADGDRRMMKALEKVDLEEMKVRERITVAVRTRLEVDIEHREAMRRAAALMALPVYAPHATKALYRTVDAIWLAAGDTSTDYNFYTKRLILSGVFSATMVFWFGDTSDGYEETWAFLDRRIADVMQIEKAKAAAQSFTGAIPSPLGFLSRLRYPRPS